MENHLIAALKRGSSDHPNRVFAELPSGETISFAAFFEGAERIAALLQAHGVAPRDRVAAQTGKSIAALQLYVGTVMAGGVYLPLNTGYTASELTHFLTDASPRIVVCDPKNQPKIKHQTGAAVFTLDTAGRGSLTDAATAMTQAFAEVPRDADHLAAILYTSGTTGTPKGAMLSHGNLASNSQTLAELWRFTSDDVLIHALPIFHTHGLFVATNIALMSGASLLFHPSFDADVILRDLPRATAMMGVPTFYTRLLMKDGLTEATRHMRLFVSGSAPLLAETNDRWADVTGHRILERYGMTETNMNTSNPYDGERRAGTVGFPLPGVEMRLTDGKGNIVEKEMTGVVEVRGPNVFQGYWNLPEKTAEELLPDGFFVTGDIGHIDDAGYLQIIGRAKDLVISGGFNVYPKEVELLIDACDGVLESAVIGVPHPDFGEAVVAIIVPKGHVTPSAITTAIAPDLARYKQPKQIILTDALPRNAMGKVQKNVLRDRYSSLFTT
ncbi:MAG: malonyl-CoA synthase [Pseudomonadota bacterium]